MPVRLAIILVFLSPVLPAQNVAAGWPMFNRDLDARLRAFESRTGKELWAGKLDRPGNAVPITDQGKNGKPYVAITAGDTLVVFALP